MSGPRTQRPESKIPHMPSRRLYLLLQKPEITRNSAIPKTGVENGMDPGGRQIDDTWIGGPQPGLRERSGTGKGVTLKHNVSAHPALASGVENAGGSACPRVSHCICSCKSPGNHAENPHSSRPVEICRTVWRRERDSNPRGRFPSLLA